MPESPENAIDNLMQNDPHIIAGLVLKGGEIIYSTDNWDISPDISRVLSGCMSQNNELGDIQVSSTVEGERKKIVSIMKKESVDELSFERQYLPEIIDKELLELSEDDGLPILKGFVESYFGESGIITKIYGEVIKFLKGSSILPRESQRLVAMSYKGEGSIVAAKDDEHKVIIYLDPDGHAPGAVIEVQRALASLSSKVVDMDENAQLGGGQTQEAGPSAVGAPAAAIYMPQQTKNTILIVSDKPEILDFTGIFLKLGDFEIIKSTNTKEALEVLEGHYHEIVVVMLDKLLPDRSGYNTFDKIKSNEKYSDIKVILFDKNFKQSGDGNDEFFPYPYIFKPPSPPGDLGVVGEQIAKKPNTEEIQKNEPYCKHCGSKLAKGQSICHVCRNKVI